MDFAVIKTGGKQYKIRKGQELLVERILLKKEKDKIIFENLLSGKNVVTRLLGEEKGEKVVIFKFKPRNRYRRKIGHRQIFSKILVEKIE